MTTTQTTPKMRIITLTDHPPVRIREDEWPVIAIATGDSYGGYDGGRYDQALAQNELDRYSLRVRQDADGRVVVYGVLDAASAWTHSEHWAGGELLAAGADVAAAIRRVGESGRLPAHIIRECIAALPPIEI